ncbi:Nucleolar Complex 2 protein [Chytriomyces hyalinus]|nr:Nucleolar Complex 2 protein [Chytriomyces hyalinus]
MGTKKATKKFMKNHLKDKVAQRRKFKKDNRGRIMKDAIKAKKDKGKPSSTETDADGVEVEETESDTEMGFANIADDRDLSFDDGEIEDNSDEEEDDLELEHEEEDEDGEGDDEEVMADDNSELDEDSDNDQDPPAKKATKKHLRGEIAEHKKQLEEVMRKDPVFYKFLMENDKDLLNFGDGDEEEEEEDEDEDEEMEEEEVEDLQKIMKGEQSIPDVDNEDEEEDASNGGPIPVTNAMLATWKKALIEQHSLRSAKKVFLAFRAVAHEGETESDDQEVQQYVAGSEKIANAITILAMKHMVGVFDHHLPVKVNKGKTPLPSTSAKWKKVSPLVKSFIKTVLVVLHQVSDEGMLRFVMRESEKLAVYFGCFPKQAKELLKHLLKLWTSTTPETRITSFLTMRRLAIACPNPYLDYAIKGAYQTFASSSRTTNLHTWSSISFMLNCFVELVGIDVASGYRFGFVYLRSLASGLRNAITMKSKESFKQVYNWQFINSLRLWTRVLCNFCESGSSAESAGGKTLRPLIYPLVQIILGTMRLKPSSKYFPLRFQCARMLIDLCKKTNVFIPLASHLFELFDTAELRGHAKPSTLKPLNFVLTLKAPAQYLGTRPYQNGIVEEVVALLMEYYDCFALSIGFPELVVPAVVQFRRWMKKSKNVSANKQIQGLLESLEQNAKFVEGKRAQVDFAPKDEAKVAAFLMDVNETLAPLRRQAIARRKMREAQMADLQKQSDAAAPDVIVDDGRKSSKAKKGGKAVAQSDSEDEEGTGFDMSDDDEDDEEEDESEEELEFEDEDEEEEEGEEEEE